MARQIDAEETFDDLHDELDYTEARLLDEPDAQALAQRPEAWRARVTTSEQNARALRREEAQVQAALVGANLAVDGVSDDFAGDLLASAGRDRTSARWRAHFRVSPSSFKRQPFTEQIATMRGWLKESQDATLSDHRARLETPVARAEVAIGRDATLAAKRGNLWAEREALAEFLTSERDGLEDELAAIGRAKGHDRGWARSFFRSGRRASPPQKGGAPS